MTRAATDLASLGALVEWPDAEAAAEARSVADPASGRFAELVEWLAGTQGQWPPKAPSRPRVVLFGEGAALGELAESVGAGLRTVTPDESDGVEAGVALADDEIDSGTDLLVVASAGDANGAANPVVVSLLCGAEPVALLPRGAAAVDTGAWIERAIRLRDARHAAADLRTDPDALLEHLADPVLATASGLLLRAAARRTPLVLDGVTATVAGVLVADIASRAARWWRVADTSDDPVHTRAVREFDQQPLLALGRDGDGTAGLLCVPMLRAAASGLS